MDDSDAGDGSQTRGSRITQFSTVNERARANEGALPEGDCGVQTAEARRSQRMQPEAEEHNEEDRHREGHQQESADVEMACADESRGERETDRVV